MTDYPPDTLAGMARWLLARVNTLAQHPAGGEAVDEIRAAVGAAEKVIDRQKRRFVIGSCVVPDCGGSLSAELAPSHETQSRIVCDADAEHTWPESHWLFLGNAVHSDRLSA